MDLFNFQFVKLAPSMEILPFHCADEDLTGFLRDDAKNYLQDLMAVTYLLIDIPKQQVAAYFSLLTDKIAYDPSNKSFWNRINRFVNNKKRRKSYPSAKVGRLAVADGYVGEHLGSKILNYVKMFLVTNPSLGCRFLTVDAYANVVNFYQKNGFQFFSSMDAFDTTRLMYFDLKAFKEQIDKTV